MADAKNGAPRISAPKALLFSIIVLALALLGAELLARKLEPIYFPYTRTIPLPAPKAPGTDALPQAIQKERVKELRKKAPDWTERLPLVASEELGWNLPPNQVFVAHGAEISVNSMNIRGPELTQKAADEFRLFTLGDSSIFGDGVREEHVFSRVAAKSLSDKWSMNVTDVIGGVPGHDTSQSRNRLGKLGWQVAPDWVIIGNLWSDVYRSDSTKISGGYGYLPPVKENLRDLALYRGLWRLYSPWLRSQQVRWIMDARDVGDLEGGIPTRIPLNRYIENLQKMVEIAGEIQAKVAFLILPAPMDFDKVPPPETVQRYRLAMEAVAEEVGAPILDGPALFRREGASMSYFSDQVHPNAEGHALLGLGLAELLAPLGPPVLDPNRPRPIPGQGLPPEQRGKPQDPRLNPRH